MEILKTIREVIALEAKSLEDLLQSVDESFAQAVEQLMAAPRKIIVCGMGKSGHIANKIAATLSSTGTPAVCMHPAESMHGDLGIVERGDTLILLSKSGESDEMIGMMPTLKRLDCKLILITANQASTLAQHSHVVLYTPIEKEACTLDLAPTCSTTSSLVVGDALAVALMSIKKFSKEDFALFHPAGRIGKRLLYKVEDLMKGGQENPVVQLDDNFETLVKVISKGQSNAVSVVNAAGELQGLVTGFDLRKAFQNTDQLKQLQAQDVMFPTPITISREAYAIEALEIMKNSSKPLNLLPVVDGGKAVGIISLQDMIRAGL